MFITTTLTISLIELFQFYVKQIIEISTQGVDLFTQDKRQKNLTGYCYISQLYSLKTALQIEFADIFALVFISFQSRFNEMILQFNYIQRKY